MPGGLSQTTNIAELVSTRQSVAPQSISGSSAVNGTGIDRYALMDPQSCVLHAMAGAVSGAPTSFTLTPKLQDSADNSAWADFDTGATVIIAANTESSRSVNLSGARRYVRAVLTPAFVGGTSPTVLSAADLVFGGAQELPAP